MPVLSEKQARKHPEKIRPGSVAILAFLALGPLLFCLPLVHPIGVSGYLTLGGISIAGTYGKGQAFEMNMIGQPSAAIAAQIAPLGLASADTVVEKVNSTVFRGWTLRIGNLSWAILY